MKIEHIKGMSVCTHEGGTWDVAIARTVSCTGAAASLNDYIKIARSMIKGEAVWHRGTLLTPGR